MSMESRQILGQNERLWMETLITKNWNEKSVAKIIKVDIESAIPEGQNYCSIIIRAEIMVTLRNRQMSKLCFIIKKARETMKTTADNSNLNAEFLVYEEVLKKIEAVMCEYKDYNEKLWCKVIGYRPYDLLVLEDLKLKNYVVTDRKKMLDLNHSKLVLHSLGRFHALGFTLIEKGLLKKEDLPSFCCNLDSILVERLYKGGLMKLSNVIVKYWTPEWKEIGDRLYKEHHDVIKKLKNLLQPQENNFITLCHGDSWTCNLMFKYSPFEENYPTACKFIDFERTHVNPYIFDVIYFLYSSVHPEVRRSNYDQLLSVYQKSLQTTLATYGFEEQTPTLEKVHSEAERAEYYGFTSYFMILPIAIADEDAFKVNYLRSDSKWMDAYNEDVFKSEFYKSAVQPDLKKWFNKGLF
uniref:CHK kinase-like domain-containing protein n=1 Tax=Rhodnius prolixus TaxID=13249 RepID=T1H8S9_RHOPR